MVEVRLKTKEGQIMTALRRSKQGDTGKTTAQDIKRLPSLSQPFEEGQQGILIGHTWRITSDSLNVTLEKRFVGKKSGKERWEPIGFYSTLANALVGLVDQGVRDTGLVSLKALSDEIEKLKQDIKKALVCN